MVVGSVYTDNILLLGNNYSFPYIKYIYESVFTIFLISGFLFITNQYYSILRSGIKDFLFLKRLGATRRNIRILILIEAFLLFIITIPLGLIIGRYLTGAIVGLLDGLSCDQSVLGLFDSISTLIVIAGIMGCVIVALGMYVERGIRKVPLSDIISDDPVTEENVFL
jgi:putative ABC transport system permease protein